MHQSHHLMTWGQSLDQSKPKTLLSLSSMAKLMELTIEFLLAESTLDSQGFHQVKTHILWGGVLIADFNDVKQIGSNVLSICCIVTKEGTKATT